MKSELLDRQQDIEKDWQTLSSYPEYVAVECTCGYSAPPVGFAESPSHHIENCAFRTNRLRNTVQHDYELPKSQIKISQLQAL